MQPPEKTIIKIGIDEVGRGPIAGPVAICALMILKDFDYLKLFPKGVLRDSKKLSEKNRNEIFHEVEKLRRENCIDYVYVEKTAEEIDQIGISKCLYNSIDEALGELRQKYTFRKENVTLDGALSKDFGNVVIKGDENFIEISLASIVAKVLRDTHMDLLHKKYPEYNFESNKGYGTAEHLAAIKKYGLCDIHRKTWISIP
jgi:ribonuclease HII